MDKVTKLELKEQIEMKRDELNKLLFESNRLDSFDNNSIEAAKTPMGICLKIYINRAFELSIAFETRRDEIGQTIYEIEDIRVFDLLDNELTDYFFKQLTNKEFISNTGIRIGKSDEFIKLLNMIKDTPNAIQPSDIA